MKILPGYDGINVVGGEMTAVVSQEGDILNGRFDVASPRTAPLALRDPSNTVSVKFYRVVNYYLEVICDYTLALIRAFVDAQRVSNRIIHCVAKGFELTDNAVTRVGGIACGIAVFGRRLYASIGYVPYDIRRVLEGHTGYNKLATSLCVRCRSHRKTAQHL
jgi:hypothetical protein